MHKCRLQSALFLDSITKCLIDRHATLDRTEDDKNELKNYRPIEQDDSETKPSSDNDGKEDDGIVRRRSRTILIEETPSSNKTLQSNQGVESDT